MEPTKVLTTLRSTYCGACFDSFENFSLPLNDFMRLNSLKSFTGLFEEKQSPGPSLPLISSLKKLLNTLFSSQIQKKKLIICRGCDQTIHLSCLPNKSYKNPQDVIFLQGASPITTFLCCICQLKSQNHLQIKEKKSKVNGACLECTQTDGFRLALQGKKRDVLLSQFVHPICALFSSVIAPKHLEEMSFFRRIEKYSSNSSDANRICFFCHKKLRSSFANCGQNKCNKQAHIYCFLKERTNFAVNNDLDLNDGILWQFYFSKSLKNNNIFKSPYYRNFGELKGSCYHQLSIDNSLNNMFLLDDKISKLNENKVIPFVKQHPSGKNMFKIRCDTHKIEKENCFCGKHKTETSYVQCECCSHWFHEACLISLDVGYTTDAKFYCCKCKFIYLENKLENGSPEVLDELNSIANRYHLKVFDRLIILQSLEKLIRTNSELPFQKIIENFNQINCFNTPIRSLEESVKLQIIKTLQILLRQRLTEIADLSFMNAYFFGNKRESEEMVRNGKSILEELKIEADIPEVKMIEIEGLNELAKVKEVKEVKEENIDQDENNNDGKELLILNQKILDLKNLIHYFGKIETQNIGKGHADLLKDDIAKLDWLYNLFKKIKELIENSGFNKVSFSFNEFWQFLKNESFGCPVIKNKIDNFMKFFSKILNISLSMVETNPESIDSQKNLSNLHDVESYTKNNELVLVTIILFLRHLKIDLSQKEFNELFGIKQKNMSFKHIGKNFQIKNLVTFISAKSEEEIKRFGGEFEEKDFQNIRSFLEKCSGLKLVAERGQQSFKANKNFFDPKVSLFFPKLEQVSKFLKSNSRFVDSFEISRAIKAKEGKSRELNVKLMTLLKLCIREIQEIQNSIYQSKLDYSNAYANYSAKINKFSTPTSVATPTQTIIPLSELEPKSQTSEPSDLLLITPETPTEPKPTPVEQATTNLTIPTLNTNPFPFPSMPAPTKPIITNNGSDSSGIKTIILPPQSPLGMTEPISASVARPSRPTINSNPFHPSNFQCMARKQQLVEVVSEFGNEGLFMRKGLRELTDFLTDYFLLNNFVYDSFEEDLSAIFDAVKKLPLKLDQALEALGAEDQHVQLIKQTKDIFKFEKCDNIIRTSKKKLNIVGSKVLRILEKSSVANWETSIETVKEILAESDYISKMKIRDFSRKMKTCLEVRSICKILRKIHNKRALEVKNLEDTKRKLLSLVEKGSMEVEFNSDNSLNQTKRESLNNLLGNTRVAQLFTTMLENIDKERLSCAVIMPEGMELEEINKEEDRRKEEKLQRLKNISLEDLENKDFQVKIASAVSGEFKTRKLPFINFELLGANSEAEMVRKVVQVYFHRKSQALENKAQHKVNLFLYLDYKKETAKYFKQGKGSHLSFRPKPIPTVEKIFSMALSLGKDKTMEYFLFNTFSRVSDILPRDKRLALIGKRGHFTENHEILGVMFSDDYQELVFREKEWLKSLEYVFQKITDLNMSEVMYSEPSRQGNGRKESLTMSRKSDIGVLEGGEPGAWSENTAEGVLVLPDSKHCTASLCASNKPNNIIKRISEKIERLMDFLENLNMMAMLHKLETEKSGLKHTVREADLKKIKDFVHSYYFAENNHILQFAKERTEQLMKIHNNLRYLLNTIHYYSVNPVEEPLKPIKGSNNKVMSFAEFMRKVDSGKIGWINLWSLDSGKRDYDKCLKKFVRVKAYKHLFPEKLHMIKMYLRSHKDLRKDVKDFTLSLKLETQKNPVLYKRIREKYWEFYKRFVKTPFYSDELHAVISQFELVFLLFSIYNEPVSLKNLVGFENLLRETGYDKLKISACGMFMDQEVEKLTLQLKKIERCLSIAQTGMFFGSQVKDFEKLDFQSCGIELKDSLDVESYLRMREEQSEKLDSKLKVSQLPTCRMVFLVTRISHISLLVKKALCFKTEVAEKFHVEQYADLMFIIYKKLNLRSDPMFESLFGGDKAGDVHEELTLQSEIKKKLDSPILVWKSLNILAHRVSNNFYAKKFSQCCLDRFLIQSQINSSWFHSEFYKKKVENFLRLQSLVFLIKRAVLSKIYWQLVQSKSPSASSDPEKEDYVRVFDEEKDHFCRQDVLKTIYIFTDLKNRHWNPRSSSRKQESRLKSQFDQKWILTQGLKHDLVDQYMNLFGPVSYRHEQQNEQQKVGTEQLKIRDYLGQIQHKYMKYLNLKLMFQKLIKRSEFFEEDKLVSVLLMVGSTLVDLCFDQDKKEITFVDIALLLKEGHLTFKKLKKRDIPKFRSLFTEPTELGTASLDKADKQNDLLAEPSSIVKPESVIPGPVKTESEIKIESQIQEMKNKMKQSIMKVKKKELGADKPEKVDSDLVIGIKLIAFFLEKLRNGYNQIRDEIKQKLNGGPTEEESGLKEGEMTAPSTMEVLFGMKKLKSKIQASEIFKTTEMRIRNLKTKHNVKTTPSEEGGKLKNPEMAVDGVITWQKLLPRAEKYSFTSVYNFNQSQSTLSQLSAILDDPIKIFQIMKNISRFFNTRRETSYLNSQKLLRKIVGKIKVSARGLLSKELEKDHSKMLYQRNQFEGAGIVNTQRIGNLMKQTGPQSSREMKKYVMSIVKGEAGSDYEEESKIQGIFNNENIEAHVMLDKNTEEMVAKLRQKELSLNDMAKMDLSKIPNADLRAYEEWKLRQNNLFEKLEQRVKANKYLEKDFIEGNQIAPAVSCLVRKMKNPSLKFKPGTVIIIEYALAKQKKLGSLLTKLMDEEIGFEELRRRCEKFYRKVKKRMEKGIDGEKKKKKVKPVEPKIKENLLDNICLDIGFIKDIVDEYTINPEPNTHESPLKVNDENLKVVQVSEILKLNIFQPSKLGLTQTSGNYTSTDCDFFFTGDSRVLKLFKGIKIYPRLKPKIKKKMTTIISSLERNPLYAQLDLEEAGDPEGIYGKSEEDFRKEFIESNECIIPGWVVISDDNFARKLHASLEEGKAKISHLSAEYVFYLGKPNLAGSVEEIAKRLWNYWGVRPMKDGSMQQGQYSPIDFSNLFVYCLKRKFGAGRKEPSLTPEELSNLKSKMVDRILKVSKAFPSQDRSDEKREDSDDSTSFKRSQYSYYNGVSLSDKEDAFSALRDSVKTHLDSLNDIAIDQSAFTMPPPLQAPILPLDFHPSPQYLGKRSNDILGAVQEIPTSNIFKGLSTRPSQPAPKTNQALPRQFAVEEAPIRSQNMSEGHSYRKSNVGMKVPRVVENLPQERSNNDDPSKQGNINSLLEIVKNVSPSDLRDIYIGLEDLEMKEMLVKAVNMYYPKNNNPLSDLIH